jgi:hypothetical protein
MHRRKRRKLVADWIAWFFRLAVWAAAASAAVAMLYAAWLPSEIVAFKPGKVSGEPLVHVNGPASPKSPRRPASPKTPLLPAVVGYVLAEDPNGRITLLDSGTRRIARHDDKNVEFVTECYFTPHGGFSKITEAPTIWLALTSLKPFQTFQPAHSKPCP